MLIGSANTFAVEWNSTATANDGWVLGHIRFWAHDKEIGDWSDTVDLRGCYSWMKEFITTPYNRYEHGLMSKSKEELFRLLYEPVFGHTERKEDYTNMYSRFHINHLGMSSFDQFDILLIEDEQQQRIIWRDARNPIIHDARFPKDTVQTVIQLFCQDFEHRLKH